jgi:hypothetical protein
LEQFAVSTDKRLNKAEEQLDFFIQKALPPKEGIFYDGQVFDAYVFVSNLIKSAKREIIPKMSISALIPPLRNGKCG